jgi:hypothetical protein
MLAPPLPQQCTSCSKFFLRSTFDFDFSKYWTDGRLGTVYMFNHTYVDVERSMRLCPHCMQPIGANRKMPSSLKFPGEMVDAREMEPTVDALHELLGRPLSGLGKHEMKIRVHLLWKQNDPIRQMEDAQKDLDVRIGYARLLLSERAEENMHSLLRLLDAQIEWQRLFAAEIYRELGLFERSLELLDCRFPTKEYSDIACDIRHYAEQGHSVVMQLPSDHLAMVQI